jgi:hypothetical protein
MGHKKPDILLIIAFVVVLGAVTGSFITDAAPDTRMLRSKRESSYNNCGAQRVLENLKS